MALASNRAEDRRDTPADVHAGFGEDVDPVVVRDDAVREAGRGRVDGNLWSGPGSAVIGREDIAHRRGRISGRAVSPGNVQSAARGHPNLVMVTDYVGIRAEDLIAREELQALPASAGICRTIVSQSSSGKGAAR